jgi:predicted lipoprotein
MRTLKNLRRTAAAAILAPLAIASAAYAQGGGTFDHAGLARQALEAHIRPGYAALVASAQTLGKELGGYCAQMSRDRRRAVDRAFDGVVSAWGRIEHIRFGPVTVDNRLERIFFWPDRRGLGARQVAATLSARDPSVLDPAALAGKRIPLQGIGALEAALFDAPSKEGEDRAYRCSYAKAIAANIAGIAGEILKEWTDPDLYSRHWLNPGAGNPHYLTPSETTLALAKAFDTGLERARDDWIAGPLGFGPQKRPLPAVLGKSGRTLRLVQAGLEGLRGLFTAGGMQKAIVAVKHNNPTVNTRINARLVVQEIETALDQIRKLSRRSRPLDPVAMQGPLIAVGFPLKNARLQAAALLTLTANLSIGFNASDGD